MTKAHVAAAACGLVMMIGMCIIINSGTDDKWSGKWIALNSNCEVLEIKGSGNYHLVSVRDGSGSVIMERRPSRLDQKSLVVLTQSSTTNEYGMPPTPPIMRISHQGKYLVVTGLYYEGIILFEKKRE